MTKAELLADLAAKDFVSWVGEPQVQGAGTPAEGVTWYAAQILELSSDSRVGCFRQVFFYVAFEEAENEVAFYANDEPTPLFQMSSFNQWMQTAIDAAPASYEGIEIVKVNERRRSVIYDILTPSGSDLTKTTYYYRDGSGIPPKVIV